MRPSAAYDRMSVGKFGAQTTATTSSAAIKTTVGMMELGSACSRRAKSIVNTAAANANNAGTSAGSSNRHTITDTVHAADAPASRVRANRNGRVAGSLHDSLI